VFGNTCCLKLNYCQWLPQSTLPLMENLLAHLAVASILVHSSITTIWMGPNGPLPLPYKHTQNSLFCNVLTRPFLYSLHCFCSLVETSVPQTTYISPAEHRNSEQNLLHFMSGWISRDTNASPRFTPLTRWKSYYHKSLWLNKSVFYSQPVCEGVWGNVFAFMSVNGCIFEWKIRWQPNVWLSSTL